MWIVKGTSVATPNCAFWNIYFKLVSKRKRLRTFDAPHRLPFPSKRFRWKGLFLKGTLDMLTSALVGTPTPAPLFLGCLARICLPGVFCSSSATCEWPVLFEISDPCCPLSSSFVMACKPQLPSAFQVLYLRMFLACTSVVNFVNFFC